MASMRKAFFNANQRQKCRQDRQEQLRKDYDQNGQECEAEYSQIEAYEAALFFLIIDDIEGVQNGAHGV